jgi:hypothetical protein
LLIRGSLIDTSFARQAPPHQVASFDQTSSILPVRLLGRRSPAENNIVVKRLDIARATDKAPANCAQLDSVARARGSTIALLPILIES